MVFIKPTQDFSVACLFRRSLLSRDKVQSEITVLCYADPFSKCTGYSADEEEMHMKRSMMLIVIIQLRKSHSQ